MKASKLFGTIAKIGAVVGAIGGTLYVSNKSLKKEKSMHDRYQQYYELSNQWMLNKNQGKDVSSFMNQKGYHTIAIYGMGTLGELFYEEIKKTDVEVAYIIDKNAEELYYGPDDLPVTNPDNISAQKEIDAVVVTPVYEFDKIEKELSSYIDNTEIISLEDIIFGL